MDKYPEELAYYELCDGDITSADFYETDLYSAKSQLALDVRIDDYGSTMWFSTKEEEKLLDWLQKRKDFRRK